MCPEAVREVPTPGETESMAELLDRSLRGDALSLEVFFTLLKTRYGRLVLRKLRRHRGYAHTATLEDVMQQSLLEFMENIRGGALPELPPGEVLDILAYFQKLCDQNLESHRKNKHTLRNRESCEPHEDIARDVRLDRAEPTPGEAAPAERKEAHLALMRTRLSRLADFDRSVMEEYMLGIPYEDIARRTGKSATALRSLVVRLKDRLIREITEVSPTARLAQESRSRADGDAETPSECPSAEEILGAIRLLPKDTQEAVRFVHLGGGTPEKLAALLGERGLEKARARLKSGCELLSLELDLPFPESFSLLKAAPDA